MAGLLTLFFALLGLCVGSFLNVVILRFGYTERNNPRSHCASCFAPLTVFDLLPVLSYVALKGRCRHCGSAISWQYPLVELVTALLFGATYVMLQPATLAQSVELLAFLGFWSALLALVVYDVRHTLIPLQFVYAVYAFALVAVLVRIVGGGLPALMDALLGALIPGGFFALIHFATRGRGMGIGDAYVAFGIGLMFGVGGGIIAAVLGVWAGALVGLLVLLLQQVFPRGSLLVGGTRVTLTTELPFAPFLALGAVAVFVFPLLPAIVGL